MRRSDFKGSLSGQSVDLFTLRNSHGLKAFITNYGSRLVGLWAPDREGNFDNIIIGYSSMPDFLEKEEAYFGAVIGRYANRIAGGTFHLEGKMHQLDLNDGLHHLHGGKSGFHQVVWGARQRNDRELHLSYRSADGEGGYPGNLGVSVAYELTDENELCIRYRAESDGATILNMSHHAYFNLSGASKGHSVDHQHLSINADRFTPVDETLIPTGEIMPVEHTPFDFQLPKPIGQDVKEDHPQLRYGRGYDHNFVLNKNKEGKLSLAAKAEDPESGRRLIIETTEPGLQFYVRRKPLPGIASAFCLEPQHFPDSPNKPQFPSSFLDAYTPYKSETRFKIEAVTESNAQN